ncbi:MAG TPA: LamG domain-containing protein [Kofleriaceae bacterium]|jgi:hypothetical protein|nr:LamG domain-containing protein [Kofleriaceae bacterium]
MHRWLVLALCGCGRLDFEPRADGATLDVAVVAVDAPPSDLIAWYRLDETGGTVFVDAIAGNNGSCANPSCPAPATGHFGGGMLFDAVDDCIVVTDLGQLHVPQFTISAWVFRNADDAGSVISKQFGAAQLNSWQLEMFVPNVLSLTSDHNDAGSQLHTPDNTLQPGRWQYFAATYDGLTEIIYVDGVQAITIANAQPISYDNRPLYIGCDFNTSFTAVLNGRLDDIRVYNRPLDPTELAKLASM